MMRVIAGLYKNRKLFEVGSTSTRPTTDKNKEKLFNILGQFFESGRVLDLFAGSGALGIEALSRGMDAGVFVDNHDQAFQTIKANIAHLAIPNAMVHKLDVMTYIAQFHEEPFDLILMDPPYKLTNLEEMLKAIDHHSLLVNEGVLVLETERSTVVPAAVGSLVMIREASEGIAKFTIYRKEETL